MSSSADGLSPSSALAPTHPDPVAEAEAMAETHLARQQEVEKVGEVVRWLDDLVRIPGTRLGFGLDAIVGLLLPGVGDVITGAVGLSVIVAALRRGVPGVVIARMLVNLGVDVLVGMIPVVGDAFDLLWRANMRNLALLERHQDELEPRARTSDYSLVGLVATGFLAAVSIPFVLLFMLLSAIF